MLLVSRSEPNYHHGNLGPALEDAALELLRTQGHATLSLREVARVAGVSHNAPYHHFGDRAALLTQLSERCMAELLGALREADGPVGAGGPSVESAEAADSVGNADPASPAGSANTADSTQAHAVRIGMAYVGYAAEHPERFHLIYDPEICIPGAPSETRAPLIEQVETILATTTAALLPGAPAAAISALATAVWGTVHGLAELVVTGHILVAEAEPALTALLGAGANR